MRRVVAAHQPNFLPYLGFFEKLRQSDIFIIRDDCQFSKSDYHHRNKIRLLNGESRWLTVPVHKKNIPLKDIQLQTNLNEKNQPWQVLRTRLVEANYRKAPFFDNYFPEFKQTLETKYSHLLDLSMSIIEQQKTALNITTPIVFASKIEGFQNSGNPSIDLATLTRFVGGDTYLSGAGGTNYLDQLPFQAHNLKVQYHHHTPTEYPQLADGFLPYMTALDALFMIGKFPGD